MGTLAPQGCGFTYDGENDGHGGYLATGIVSANQLPGWLAISQPDIVMMELGTNDVWSHLATATIIAAFSTLVDQMRAQKSTMRILVAQITPMNPSGCTDCAQGVIDLNKAIVAWAPTKSTAASPITVVDCWTGYNTTADTGDGVHPNDSGNAKLATCWYEPLKAAIALTGGTVTPTSTTSTSKPGTTLTTTATTKSTSSTRTTSAATTSTSSAGTVPLYGQCGKAYLRDFQICVCSFMRRWSELYWFHDMCHWDMQVQQSMVQSVPAINIESGHAVETQGQVKGLVGHDFRCRILDVNIEYREMCTQDLKIILRFY